MIRAGTLGRIGVLQGASEVSTQTADAVAYSRAVRTLFVGETPTLDGIRGYVGGLALRSVLAGDQSLGARDVDRRLRAPKVFTDALLTPRAPSAPGRGSQAVIVISPQFIASTITPVQQGGQRFDGTYFPDGAWINASVTPTGRAHRPQTPTRPRRCRPRPRRPRPCPVRRRKGRTAAERAGSVTSANTLDVACPPSAAPSMRSCAIGTSAPCRSRRSSACCWPSGSRR